MRLSTYRRAAVLLTVLLAVQGGASAVADTKDPRPRPAAPSDPRGGHSGSIDPLTPFAQGAARFAQMTAPFVNAASDVFFPRG
ncbi:hypothetical protein [Streptomyces sp. enrichment culture]|uniref:hypothetical protein n=1 Tax=Streptomyces sp. enrichment culture TaxID=1795815 RepID=UPI003F55B71C